MKKYKKYIVGVLLVLSGAVPGIAYKQYKLYTWDKAAAETGCVDYSEAISPGVSRFYVCMDGSQLVVL